MSVNTGEMMDEEDMREQQHYCSSCDKTFPSGYGLKRHVESVHLMMKQQQEKRNVCESCGKDFSTRFALKTHTNSVHLKIRNFACTFCEYRGSDRTSLERHINAYHIDFGSLLCDICGKKFYERFKLERHKKVHMAPQEICERCGMEFRLKANLKKHIEAVHLKKWKVLKCGFCDYTARKRCYLKQHVSRYHADATTAEEDELSCSVCGLKMSSRRKLLAHFQSAHRSTGEPSVKSEIVKDKVAVEDKEAEFACPECERAFARKCDLRGHLHRHHTDKHSYPCKFCQHRSSKIMELHNHMAELHSDEPDYAELTGQQQHDEKEEQSDLNDLGKEEENDEEDDYLSGEDEQISDNDDDFIAKDEEQPEELPLEEVLLTSEPKEHNKSKERRKATCDQCGNVFVDKYALKNHVEAVHFKLKKYSCDLCEFRTASKSTLTRHSVCVHNQDKNSHLCDICAKSFNAAHKLKRHYVIHLAPREMCHTCGRAFKIKAELKRHVADIHLKAEKTKRCDLCDYASSRNFHLKRHMEMVHQGLKRFTCHLCGKAMSLKCNLDKHIRTVHEKKQRGGE